MNILNLAYWLLQAYWIWAVGFMLIFALAAFLPQRKQKKAPVLSTRFLVLIPAYKEDGVIVETARQALMQFYPHQLYDVAVIADQLNHRTLTELNKLPIEVVHVNFENSTKAKALRKALDDLPEIYHAVAILDADNHAAPDFLIHMNNSMREGYVAVQGRRIPKNKDSHMAILDGVSEEINNRIYCKGHNALEFSSKLSGSGMAFEYHLFKEIMQTVDAVGGFDKELELKYTQRGKKVIYDHHAKVYDEKVSSGKVFAKQRKRWLSAQYHYLRRFFLPGLKQLFTSFNIDFFNRVIQLALPPRLLMPAFLGLATVISIIIGQGWIFWSVLFLLNVLSFVIAIPAYLWNEQLFKSLLRLPVVIWYAFLAIIRLKGANKQFIHTPHGMSSEES